MKAYLWNEASLLDLVAEAWINRARFYPVPTLGGRGAKEASKRWVMGDVRCAATAQELILVDGGESNQCPGRLAAEADLSGLCVTGRARTGLNKRVYYPPFRVCSENVEHRL